MKHFKLPLFQTLALMLALSFPAAASEPLAKEADAPPSMDRPVGKATQDLLQRQREGQNASITPRPIDGEIADLSRQRLHKSYQDPLPRWFGSRLDNAPR